MIPRMLIADDGGSDGLIDPATFPKVDHWKVTDASTDILLVGVHFSAYVDDVARVWKNISAPGVYETPESAQVYALLDPAVKAGTDVYNDMVATSKAMDTFASDLEAIEPDLAKLVTDANEFRKEALAEHKGLCSKEEATSQYDPSEAGVTDVGIQYFRNFAWWELEYYRDRNRQYYARLADILSRLNVAETTCADKIHAIGPGGVGQCTKAYSGAEFEQAILSGIGPWGTPPGEPAKSCGDKYVESLIAKPINQAITTVEVLFSGYDPRTGLYGNTQLQQAAWNNIGNTILGLTVTIVAFPDVMLATALKGMGVDTPVTNWLANQGHTAAQVVAGSFGVDVDAKDPFHRFKEDPGDAWADATWGIVNTALLVVGVGEATSAIRGAAALGGRATAVVATTEILDLVLPGTKLISNGILKVTGLSTKIFPEIGAMSESATRAVASAERTIPGAEIYPGRVVGLGDGTVATRANINVLEDGAHITVGSGEKALHVEIGADGIPKAYHEGPGGVRTEVKLADDVAETVLGADGKPVGYKVKLPDGTEVVLVADDATKLPGRTPAVQTTTGAAPHETPSLSEGSHSPTSSAHGGDTVPHESLPHQNVPHDATSVAPPTEYTKNTPHSEPGAHAAEPGATSVPREPITRQGVTLPDDYKPLELSRGNPGGSIETRALPNNGVLEFERDANGEVLRMRARTYDGGTYSRTKSGPLFANADARELSGFNRSETMRTAKATYPDQDLAAGHMATVQVAGNAESRILAGSYDVTKVFEGRHADAAEAVERLRRIAQEHGGVTGRDILDLPKEQKKSYNALLREERDLNIFAQDAELNSKAFKNSFEAAMLKFARSADVPYVDFVVEKVGLADDVMPRYLAVAYQGGGRLLTEEFFFNNITGEVIADGPRLRI